MFIRSCLRSTDGEECCAVMERFRLGYKCIVGLWILLSEIYASMATVHRIYPVISCDSANVNFPIVPSFRAKSSYPVFLNMFRIIVR